MADVRYTTGTPITADFGGISTPTPSTPLIINNLGELWALISNVVTLVGGVPSNSQLILATQVFDKHPQGNPAVLMGNASDVIQSRVFRSGIATGLWG